MSKVEEIKWDQSYETGVSEIDNQHKILIKILNDSQSQLSKNFSFAILDQITKDLINYALYHFETEEELMLKNNYNENRAEEYALHIKQHRSFSSKVVSIRESIQIAKPINQMELIDYLKDWLINHINKTDKKLGEYLQSSQ